MRLRYLLPEATELVEFLPVAFMKKGGGAVPAQLLDITALQQAAAAVKPLLTTAFNNRFNKFESFEGRVAVQISIAGSAWMPGTATLSVIGKSPVTYSASWLVGE